MNLDINAQDLVARKDPSRRDGILVHEVGKTRVESQGEHVEIGRDLCLPNLRDNPTIIYLPAPPPEYNYDLPPTDMILATRAESRQIGLADGFGGGHTVYRGSSETDPSVFYDPNIEPEWIFYSGSGHGWINRVKIDNTSASVIVDAYHLGFSGSGKILKMVVVPTGHLLAWGRMATTASSYAALRRWAWPDPSPTTANGVTIYQPPGGLQGGSYGDMTIDYERGMVYMSHGTRNGSAGIYRCAWNGAISSVVYSWGNGTSGLQPVPTAITYVPRDDMIYYINSGNLFEPPPGFNELYFLYRIRPDGSDHSLVAELNPDNPSAYTTVAMTYNSSANLLYIAINENGRRGAIDAYSLEGVKVGTVNTLQNVEQIYDIHLTNIAS